MTGTSAAVLVQEHFHTNTNC